MIADEVLSYIQAEGLGTKNTNLFLAFQPEDTDNCTTFFDETTFVAEESDSLNIDQFGVQVLVRNTSYIAARDLLISMHKRIIGFGGEKLIVGGHDVGSCYLTTPPSSIGKDEKNRSEWTAHYMFRVLSQGDKYRS